MISQFSTYLMKINQIRTIFLKSQKTNTRPPNRDTDLPYFRHEMNTMQLRTYKKQ